MKIIGILIAVGIAVLFLVPAYNSKVFAQIEVPIESTTDSSYHLLYEANSSKVSNAVYDSESATLLLETLNQNDASDDLTVYLLAKSNRDIFSMGPDCITDVPFILINGNETDYDLSEMSSETTDSKYIVYDFKVPPGQGEVRMIGINIPGLGSTWVLEGIKEKHTVDLNNQVSIKGKFAHQCGNPVFNGDVMLQFHDVKLNNQTARTDTSGTFEIVVTIPEQYVGEAITASISGSKNNISTPVYKITLSSTSEKNSQTVKPPLKQYRQGIPFSEIACEDTLVLVQKYDGSPACVASESKNKLIERGWIPTNGVHDAAGSSNGHWKLKTEAFVATSLKELTPIDTVKVGGQYSATAILTKPPGWSDQHPELGYVMYVQVLDPNGDRIAGSWHNGIIKINQTISGGAYWSPKDVGNYTIEVFAWQSFTGNPHADVTRTHVEVTE